MNFFAIFLVCCLLMWILIWIGGAILPSYIMVVVLPALFLAILLDAYVDLNDRIEKLEKQLNPTEEEPEKDSATSPVSSET